MAPLCRQGTVSSSAVPTRPTLMPASSRSPRCSCCCWTVCGSCGISSPWPWASLSLCSWGWRTKLTHPTMAPFCATATKRGQLGSCGWWPALKPNNCDISDYCPSLPPLRCSLGVMKNTHCLFQALLRPSERENYSNLLYESTELAIWPSVHPQSLQLWRGNLQPEITMLTLFYAVNERIVELYCTHSAMKIDGCHAMCICLFRVLYSEVYTYFQFILHM